MGPEEAGLGKGGGTRSECSCSVGSWGPQSSAAKASGAVGEWTRWQATHASHGALEAMLQIWDFIFSGSPSKELMWGWQDSSSGWRPLGRLLQDEKGCCLAWDGCEDGVEGRDLGDIWEGVLRVMYQQGRWSDRELWWRGSVDGGAMGSLQDGFDLRYLGSSCMEMSSW